MNLLAIILKALSNIENSQDPIEARMGYILKREIEWEVEQARKAEWKERHEPPTEREI